MCTLTIQRMETSVLVTMNRDEARFRAAEKPPRIILDEQNALHWLAPTDGQAGGTWFGVNEYAVQACLLNRYMPEDFEKLNAPGIRPSRGQIIVDLLAKGREKDAFAWTHDFLDPTLYPSFHLIVLGPSQTQSFAWNGKTLEKRLHPEAWLFFSSSSWRTEEVIRYRQDAFDVWVAQGAPNEGFLPTFHVWQPADRAEWAPLMDREISATRSITQTMTDFTKRSTEMRYWPRESRNVPMTPLTILSLPHALDTYPSNSKPFGSFP